MLFQGALIATFTILQVTNSFNMSLQNDNIEPVELNFLCLKSNEEDDGQNKSPILLVHGLGASLTSWKNTNEMLSVRTGRRVCAVDLRNHGDSPWNNRIDIPSYVADIKHFLEKQKIEKINIIGQSLGGKVAVHYALTYPEQVDSIVIEDMKPNGISETALLSIRMFILFLRKIMKTVPEGSTELEAQNLIVGKIDEKLKQFGVDAKLDENADMLPIRCPDGKCQYKFNIDIYMKSLENPSEVLVESNGQYDGPALFIYGKASEFDIGGDEENIRKLFPNAKLVGVEGAGHLIHGFFKEFDEEVVKFLNE